jgi:hypothetical protein
MTFRLLFLLSPLLTSCATSYAPESFSGGFSDTQLSENVYRVSFQGNGFTHPDRTSDFALVRSAELTLRGGYRYFTIGDSADRTQSMIVRTPTTTTANAYVSGNTLYGTATTTGGALIPVIKPGVALTIYCSCDRPDPAFFDAAFLVESLSAKYRLDALDTHAAVSRCPSQEVSRKAALYAPPPARPTATLDETLRRDIISLGQNARYPFVNKLSDPMLVLLKSGRATTTAHAYLLACETDVECAEHHGLK